MMCRAFVDYIWDVKVTEAADDVVEIDPIIKREPDASTVGGPSFFRKCQRFYDPDDPCEFHESNVPGGCQYVRK